MNRHHIALMLLCLAGMTLAGCGYSFERPYRKGVNSVSVELFARGGQVFRREIELRATEAIKKRIQHQTDYVLTDRGRADTLLTGAIEVVSQTNLTTEPDRGRPRESEVTFKVSFRWIDRRTGEELARRENMLVSGTYTRIAPLDEDFTLARDEAIDELSRRVVEAMERPIADFPDSPQDGASDEPGASDS